MTVDSSFQKVEWMTAKGARTLARARIRGEALPWARAILARTEVWVGRAWTIALEAHHQWGAWTIALADHPWEAWEWTTTWATTWAHLQWVTWVVLLWATR